MELKSIQQGIDRGRAFVICTHVNPDADGVGAAVAFAWLLQRLGKSAWIVKRERLPGQFRFIEEIFPVHTDLPAAAADADTWVVLDASRSSRTDFPPPAGCTVINIDHHADNEYFGDFNWVDSSAAATAVMVFGLIRAYGLFTDRAVAESLYAGILIDTGGFKFSNTNAGVFSACAELAACGVDCQRLYNLVFLGKPFARFRLEGQLMSRAELLQDGRVCLMAVTEEAMAESGAARDQLEGLSNLTMGLRGVEVGIMFIAQAEAVKVCLRSDGAWNVGEIATRFGGGGHAAAAGCTLPGGIAAARVRVMDAVAALLTPALAAAAV
ncbi:MAG: DHH family phosphoesterase [Fibrobacterota bacterium]